jgi:hypothetical protein
MRKQTISPKKIGKINPLMKVGVIKTAKYLNLLLIIPLIKTIFKIKTKIKRRGTILKRIKTPINSLPLIRAKRMDFCRLEKIEEEKIFKKLT